MCGIFGAFGQQGFDNQKMKAATDALSHRGPDAGGYYTSPTGKLFFGHRRLSIIDLSDAANQPMHSACGRYSIIFNGEVYNFAQIAAEILKQNPAIRFETSSDTEVILQSYILWGVDCVQKWNGMFAVAIYDHQTEDLFLVRDRFGVKPIVYFYQDNNFYFASELKALSPLMHKPELSMDALHNYLHFDYIPKPLTIYKDVFKFPNGHYAIVNKDGIKFHEYYRIIDKFGAKHHHLTEAEALEGFSDLLADATKLRMISDVPVGAFLSGGTDSSLVVANFQKQSDTPINSFTIGFDVAKYDETKYARQVADILKTNHHEYTVDEAFAKEYLPNVWKYYDEPFVGPSTLPSLIVCNKARQAVTVALSGDGGDELFMGYNTYVWYNRLKKVEKAGGSLARNAVKLGLSLTGKTRRASRLFAHEGMDKMMLHMWSEEQGMFSEKEINNLIGKGDYNFTPATTWQEIDKLDIDDKEKISLFDISHYLADNLLYKMDIASMASSLEVRLPYLDYRFVEYALNLPVSLKIKQNEQKYLMKKSLEQYIPNELIYRQKWGFPAPVGNWMLGSHAFLIDQYLNQKYIETQGIFQYAPVKKLVDDFRSGKFFHFKRVWALVVFQLWYEEHFLKN